MKISSIRLRNVQAFADSGLVVLEPITVFVGRNNAGKSAILNSIRLIQAGLNRPPAEMIRVGSSQAQVLIEATDLPESYQYQQQPDGLVEVLVPKGVGMSIHVGPSGGGEPGEARDVLPGDLPGAQLLTLAVDSDLRRFDEQVNMLTSRQIRSDIGNLPALMASLTNAAGGPGQEFARASQDLFGFHLGLVPSENGQVPGLVIDDENSIRATAMGSGLIRLARLLVYLVRAPQRILLIEEPENDLHPDALRYILDLIGRAAETHQVILTTHSHVVVNHLARASGCAIHRVDMTIDDGVPTATVERCTTAEERLTVLRDLGHQLADFGLFEAYLILEESSAEVLIQRLMAWFTPRLLGRIRTIAAYGAEDAIPRFSDLCRLFVFVHLDDIYRGRAWVVLDGDEAGTNVAEKLRSQFQNWPEEHFLTLSETAFEFYYPDPFRERAETILQVKDKQERRRLKKELLAEVIAWIDEDENRAREQFEHSAHAVIEILTNIETTVLEQTVGPAAAERLSQSTSTRWEQTFTTEEETGPAVNLTKGRRLILNVQPGEGCHMWRFGLKFSTREAFTGGRFGLGFPLWHLTKNSSSSQLFVTYYDERGVGTGEVLVRRTYHDDEVLVEIAAIDNHLTIHVEGDPGYERQFLLESHAWVQPTAWADGNPVNIHVNGSSE